MLLAFIPLLAWLALALWLLGWVTPRITLREALLTAALFAAAWLVLGTEILSLFHAISFIPVLILWLTPLTVFTAFLCLDPLQRWQQLPRLPRLNRTQVALLAAVIFCLAWSGIQAGFSAPATADSLTYHLPRQVFWMQQAGVEHYPTSSLHQLAMPPLAEFAGLHLMVLTGSDSAHNFIQWISFLLATLAVSLITRKYNPTATAQLVSAIVVVTIPMAFIEASNTKNDDVVALWTVTALYFVLQLDQQPAPTWRRVSCIALSFGALLLTKGTGFIYGLPIAILLLFCLPRRQLAKSALAILTIAAIVLAMNGPHLWRNYHVFGSPIPSDPVIHGGDTVNNQDFSPRAITSNILRNLAPHFVLPSQAWNDNLLELMRNIHQRLGIDINDPKTTYEFGHLERYGFFQNNEGYAAEPAHMFLLLCLPVLLIFTWRHVPRKPILILLALVVADFLLFCLLLKYQTWHVRLIVTMPMLLAPVFAWTWCNPAARRWFPTTGSLVLLLGLLASLNCFQRPMFGPNSILFADRDATRFNATPPFIANSDLKVTRIVMSLHPNIVGFHTGWNSNDYLLQRLLLDRLAPPPLFTPFNASLQIPGKPEPDPNVLLSLLHDPILRHDNSGTLYRQIADLDSYSIYVKADSLPPPPTAPPATLLIAHPPPTRNSGGKN